MERAQALAWKERWRLVREKEIEDLKAMSIEERLRQLDTMFALARELGSPPRGERAVEPALPSLRRLRFGRVIRRRQPRPVSGAHGDSPGIDGRFRDPQSYRITRPMRSQRTSPVSGSAEKKIVRAEATIRSRATKPTSSRRLSRLTALQSPSTK